MYDTDLLEHEVDTFAGGGGASEGMKAATGREPACCINHDLAAIAMHEENHPGSFHMLEDVWKVKPGLVTRLRFRNGKWELPKGDWQEQPRRHRIGLLWASPDCKHFSRAKGSKPVEKAIRSLAWVVCRWAAEESPRVIILENVREFAEWGPLVPAHRCADCGWRGTEGQATLVRTRRKCPRCDGRRLRVTDELIPDPARKGVTFKRFVGRVRNLGYQVEWRNLNASDYGAPTHRRRLFLIARNDGLPITWPEPSHGDPAKIAEQPLFAQLKPWRTAAECIDWSLPCPSIFDRKRPLADKTMRRIAMGIKRYVLDNQRPFIVRCNHGGEHFRGQQIDMPFCTVTSSRDAHGLVVPIVATAEEVAATMDAYRILNGESGDKAVPTYEEWIRDTGHLGGSREEYDRLYSPFIAGVGGRMGQSPPAAADSPLNTITAKNDRAVVAPVVVRIGQNGSSGKHVNGADEPLTTITSKAEHLIVAPTLVQVGYGEREGQAPRTLDLQSPLGTVVSGGGKHALVSAFIAKHFGGMVGTDVDKPLPTTTTKGCQNQLVAASLVRMNHGDKQWSPVDEPLRTVTSGNHAALVYSFLVKYLGTAIGATLTEPLHTATTKGRFGLVTVTIDGELYVIVDIGMRMLTPRELARAQGFPDSYKLTGSKTAQVGRIGNSVCPAVARALVAANYTPNQAAVELATAC